MGLERNGGLRLGSVLSPASGKVHRFVVADP